MNYDTDIVIAECRVARSKTWHGLCTSFQTTGCTHQCIMWENARDGSCEGRFFKRYCVCRFDC